MFIDTENENAAHFLGEVFSVTAFKLEDPDAGTCARLAALMGFEHFDVTDAGKPQADSANYGRWHFHDDDEIRHCIGVSSGEPIFEFPLRVGNKIVPIALHVEPGTFIHIPANLVHRFRGGGLFTRYFKDNHKWEAQYPEKVDGVPLDPSNKESA